MRCTDRSSMTSPPATSVHVVAGSKPRAGSPAAAGTRRGHAATSRSRPTPKRRADPTAIARTSGVTSPARRTPSAAGIRASAALIAAGERARTLGPGSTPSSAASDARSAEDTSMGRGFGPRPARTVASPLRVMARLGDQNGTTGTSTMGALATGGGEVAGGAGEAPSSTGEERSPWLGRGLHWRRSLPFVHRRWRLGRSRRWHLGRRRRDLAMPARTCAARAPGGGGGAGAAQPPGGRPRRPRGGRRQQGRPRGAGGTHGPARRRPRALPSARGHHRTGRRFHACARGSVRTDPAVKGRTAPSAMDGVDRGSGSSPVAARERPGEAAWPAR